MEKLTRPFLPPQRRVHAAWTLAALWLLATAGGWWLLEFRPLRAQAAGGWAAFDGEALQRAAAPLLADARNRGRPLALHFRDPDCACNALTGAVALEMAQRGATRAINSYVVNAPGSRDALPWSWTSAGMAQLAAANARQLWQAVPASPAVALFNARGELVYVGGYGRNGGCSPAAPAAALTAMTDNAAAGNAGGITSGCLCRRQTAQDRIQQKTPENLT